MSLQKTKFWEILGKVENKFFPETPLFHLNVIDIFIYSLNFSPFLLSKM